MLPTSRQGASVSLRPRSACVDFFFDFVALRGCIGADGAFTVAAIASCPSQRRSRGGNASTFAPRSRRGTAGDRPARPQRQHLRHPALARDSRRPPRLRSRRRQKRARSFRPSRSPRRSLRRRRQNQRRQDQRRKSRRQRHPARHRLTRPALPMWPEERLWCRSWRAR